MIEIKDKKNCSGCHACVNICPKKCIVMKEDKEGFLYPVIDQSQCIKCGLCSKICPILNKQKMEEKQPQAFAAYNKDLNIRKQSSSGGMFSIIANYVLENNGVVFGAAFDENFEVKHICVEDKEDLEKIRKSKYVQSKIGDTYSEAKAFLEEGKQVLFTGTPCQVAGLHSYLRKDYDNLLTQDIICHGVPSPGIWRAYLSYRAVKAKSKIKDVAFRKKINSWRNSAFVMRFENGKTYIKKPHHRDPMNRMFLHDKCLRPSCYDCAFKTKNRQSDFTLADFWGIKGVAPDMDDKQGTSLVVIHSAKAEKLFSMFKNQIEYKPVDLDLALRKNRSMISSAKPYNREVLMKDFQTKPFAKVVKKHGTGIY